MTGTVTLRDIVGARSIAIVGASERNIIAGITIDNLRRLRYPGRVFGLHPSAKPVDGVETFADWGDAGGPADVALLAVGAPRVVAALRTAAGAGVPAAIIPGAGANEGGRAIEADLRAAVEETRVRVVGPNCMGVASLHRRRPDAAAHSRGGGLQAGRRGDQPLAVRGR